MRNYNNLKAEKNIYFFFVIFVCLAVNIFIGFFSYDGLSKNIQIVSSEVSSVLNRNIEKNKNIATALGNAIPLSNNTIRETLGVNVDEELNDTESPDYYSHVMFSPKEISYPDRRISIIINAFWNNLSDESKSPYWTYFTNPERKYYFSMNEQEFLHYKNNNPHLVLDGYMEKLSKKLETEKEFLVSDVFYSNVYNDALTGLPTITIGAPVILNNQNLNKSHIQGVIVTDYTLNDLNDIFKKYFVKNEIDIDLYDIKIKSIQGNDVAMQIATKKNAATIFPVIKNQLSNGFVITANVSLLDVFFNAKWEFLVSNLIILIFAFAFRIAHQNSIHMMDKLRYDSLTKAFSREGGEMLINALSIDQKMMIVAVDLNDFKKINDSYGHHVGDLALTYFSETLHAILRKSDSVIRMGGDEFLLLLPECCHYTADVLMQRAQGHLQHFNFNGLPVPVSCSYGIHEYTGDFSADYQNADEKLYEMKKSRALSAQKIAMKPKDERLIDKENSACGILSTLDELRNDPECYNQRSILAVIHLSNYSSLTNLLGHDYGQALIDHLISRLKATLPENILLGQERADKLIVVFPPLQNSEQLIQWQQKINSLFTVREGVHSGKYELRIVGNAGLVEELLIPERFNNIVRNAGIALQHTRMKGNRTVVFFTPEMQKDGLHQIQLHEQLRLALEHDEFHLVMQPIVDLAGGRTCREGECLVRWQSPVLGFVPPDKFISLAEETGLIIPLGEWIIDNACKQLAAFIASGAPADFKLHINISPLQLQQNNFARELLNSLQREGLQGNNICVEITEGVLLESDEHILKQLSVLRESGVTVALDDFGSGYSSLSYLHTLPFDQLKIDRQFVNGMLNDKRSESVIASVLHLARIFEVPLVAEGIEDDETGEKLRSMGCTLAQGYYYGRPQPFNSWSFNGGHIHSVA